MHIKYHEYLLGLSLLRQRTKMTAKCCLVVISASCKLGTHITDWGHTSNWGHTATDNRWKWQSSAVKWWFRLAVNWGHTQWTGDTHLTGDT